MQSNLVPQGLAPRQSATTVKSPLNRIPSACAEPQRYTKFLENHPGLDAALAKAAKFNGSNTEAFNDAIKEIVALEVEPPYLGWRNWFDLGV